MKNTDMTLNQKIENWLLKGGYPLEMRVANILQEQGFFVEISKRYKDPLEGKIREIDVVAKVVHQLENAKHIAINLIIECKYSPNKPWILFKNIKKDELFIKEYNMMSRFFCTAGSGVITSLLTNDKFPEKGLFKSCKTRGYTFKMCILE
jgi:hypothetical protein